MDYLFRDLNADEIDVRVGQVKKSGVTLLLYKDARVDMDILDEKFGNRGWQRKHYEVKGNLFCSVGIFNTDIQEWIWKDDCGTESNTEKQKGEASDSFKRACVNWGIGRELYTAPFIFVKVPIDYDETKKKATMKNPYTKFSVEKIKIENKKIIGLSILREDDEGTERCFKFYKEGLT